MPALFVSDIHLHPSRPQTARRFTDFLAGPAKGADALYILGDLFDAWVGDDDIRDPFNAAICAALKGLSGGTRLFFLPGNRDFLASRGFAAVTGAVLIADEIVVDIAGTPTLLLHGDTLCTDDLAYQDFRSLVRSPAWQREFLARPLPDRKAEIASLRARSEAGKRENPAELMDANPTAVEAAYTRHGVARIIHGHTHRQACHRDAGRERWVLPDWDDDRGTALLCDATGCRWLAGA